MANKKRVRVAFLSFILLLIVPIFESKQMSVASSIANSQIAYNASIEVSQIINALASYFVLKYKNDIAEKEIKSLGVNTQQDSYEKLLSTYNNLLENIPVTNQIHSLELDSIIKSLNISENISDKNNIEDPKIISQLINLPANISREQKIHSQNKQAYAVANFSSKSSKLKSEEKNNKIFEHIFQGVHESIERKLYPKNFHEDEIKYFVATGLKQMGELGAGLYFDVKEHVDNGPSEFAKSVISEQDRQSNITINKINLSPDFKQKIASQLESICKILEISNTPNASLTDIVQSRLLLPYLDTHYPYKHDLYYCQDKIIDRYFHHNGNLRDDLSFDQDVSVYIANLAEELFNHNKRCELIYHSGLAHGKKIGESRKARSIGSRIKYRVNHAANSICQGKTFVNAIKSEYNKDFFELIDLCKKRDFQAAGMLLSKYGSSLLMYHVFHEHYNPFIEARSIARKVTKIFADTLSKASNDFELADIILNNINDINGNPINPQSIDLAIATIKQAGGTEISKNILEILEKHKLSTSSDSKKILQAFASETEDLKRKILARDNSNSKDEINIESQSENNISNYKESDKNEISSNSSGLPPDPEEDKHDFKNEEKKQEIKELDSILKESKRLENSDYCKQYERQGGFEKSLKDFETLPLSDIKNISPEKRIGKLADGRIVNVRKFSKEGRSTLEILNPKNRRSIKIRYN